ncbi:MAG: ArnT family glycosyltransferase [Syntrophobacteraceae bacterium]
MHGRRIASVTHQLPSNEQRPVNKPAVVTWYAILQMFTRHNRFIYPVVLVALWSAIFVATIDRPALFDNADSFRAEVVREMLQSGDWVTMRIDNGIRYLEKAPLMYWLAAFAVSAFGLHDWTIRLPLAIFSLLLILLVFRFGARLWGKKAGF